MVAHLFSSSEVSAALTQRLTSSKLRCEQQQRLAESRAPAAAFP
jgi:hypothetical protein